MFKTLRTFGVVALTLGALSFAPNAVAEGDWVADWQAKLNELWGETKTQTQKIASDLNQRFNPPKPVEIGVAYGSEKTKWFTWAVEEFAKTENGKKVKVNLIKMGSIEGADAVLKEDKRIHVWSPASSLVENLLVDPWQATHKKTPIVSDAILALTPMVIVMWEDRYNAFMQKYNAVNFKTLAEAAAERTGWNAIAQKPEWGLFSFGYTQPNKSNSGLMSLVLMAYDYHDLFRNIKSKHVMDEGFLTWMEQAQDNFISEEHSTGTLMKTMLTRGPSKYNSIMVYENLALSNLGTAKGRWGEEIKVIYPSRSVWNDNPFYILDTPWSSKEHQDAAKLFQQFLLSNKSQKVARDEYLFRPASVDTPILDADSSFTKLKDIVKIDVPTIKRPSAEVLKQLIQVWERNQ